MRPYPRNSPEAAARVLALALMADGEVSSVELSRLEDRMAHARLGLSRPVWLRVLHEVSAELRGRPAVEADTLARLLDEVDDPVLRATVLDLSRDAIAADGIVTAAEQQAVDALSRRWRGGSTAGTPAVAA